MNVRLTGIGMIFVFIFLVSCVSTNTGGLMDLKAENAPTVELKFEDIRWNSPPLIEFGIRKGRQLGYYSRPEDLEGDIDALEVYDLNQVLLFTVTAFIDNEGRELFIDDTEGRVGTLRSPYAPSTPHSAELDFAGTKYSLAYGYARKGGAEGYRHKQWILSSEGIVHIIYNTRDHVEGDVETKILTTDRFLGSGNDALLWSSLSLLMFELDQIDRDREVQEAAMDYLLDEAQDDSGLKLF